MKNKLIYTIDVICILFSASLRSEGKAEKKYYLTIGGVFTGNFFSGEYFYKSRHSIGVSVSEAYNTNYIGKTRIVTSPFGEIYQADLTEKRHQKFGEIFYRYYPFESNNLFLKASFGMSSGHSYKIEESFGVEIPSRNLVNPVFQGEWQERQNYVSHISMGYRIDSGENSFMILEAGMGQRLFSEKGHTRMGLSAFSLYALFAGERIDYMKYYWKSKYYENINVNKSGTYPLFYYGIGIRF